MPITMLKDHKFFYDPTPRTNYKEVIRKLPLPEAFQMVVNGKINAMEVFKQLPKKDRNTINEVCQDSFNKDMEYLPIDEQKRVFEMILGALEIAKESANQNMAGESTYASTHAKKWWQFWR